MNSAYYCDHCWNKDYCQTFAICDFVLSGRSTTTLYTVAYLRCHVPEFIEP